MSRIGRMPIAVPAGVTVDIAENNKVTVKGPKGTLERVLPAEMEIKLEEGVITVARPNDLKRMKSLHGLSRTLVNNMVVGVTEGYSKKLEVNGVGYKVAKAGNKLTLSLGYSHPVEMTDPDGIESDPNTSQFARMHSKGIHCAPPAALYPCPICRFLFHSHPHRHVWKE